MSEMSRVACMPRIIEVEHNWQTRRPMHLIAAGASCLDQPTPSRRRQHEECGLLTPGCDEWIVNLAV